MAEDRERICPNCEQKDITCFRTCKFCGTKYNAIIFKDNAKSSELDIVGILVTALLIGVLFYGKEIMDTIKAKRFASVSESVQVTNRPRLIEFYSSSCCSKQGLAYEPLVGKCETKYSKKIDFQRLCVNDQNNFQLACTLDGGGFAIGPRQLPVPVIYIFNRTGKEVAEIRGSLTYAELDKRLQDPGLFK